MKTRFLLPLFLLLFFVKTWAQSPVGLWKTVDEKNGRSKGQIEFFEKDGMLFGKVVKLNNDTLNHICTACPGERKGQRMLGMVLMENLKYKNGYWQGGRVLSPKQGKWFDLKVWFEQGNPNVLVLRAYWGWLYRTQKWVRV